jgi:hypothetical protein
MSDLYSIMIFLLPTLSWSLTLSNPIFLPPVYSPALIYFGRERGWWDTCNYPAVLKEKNININRKSTTCTICWLKSVLHEEKRREQENHNVGRSPTLWLRNRGRSWYVLPLDTRANLYTRIYFKYNMLFYFLCKIYPVSYIILKLTEVLLTTGTRCWWRSGWGTALQTGKSRDRFPKVSLEFFNGIILLVALWPWGRLSL